MRHGRIAAINSLANKKYYTSLKSLNPASRIRIKQERLTFRCKTM